MGCVDPKSFYIKENFRMIRIAILVDGAFYLRRANYLWGDKNPKDRARELVQYCSRHYMNKKLATVIQKKNTFIAFSTMIVFLQLRKYIIPSLKNKLIYLKLISINGLWSF